MEENTSCLGDGVRPAAKPSWLNLASFGLYRDARVLIYRQLDAFDFALVQAAHQSSRMAELLDEWFAEGCAEHGYLQLLIWARERGCDWDEWTCVEAAANGFVDILVWAHANGCVLDRRVCEYAAAGGHLKVLQMARELRCPWSAETCARAAENGHLEVIWQTMACAF